MNANEEAPRMATVLQQGQPAGRLEEIDGKAWQFTYFSDYAGQPVSLTMPVRAEPYHFEDFPPPFEGLLPEGIQLEALLRKHKIDRDDPFNQLLVVGADLVGSLSVEHETKTPEGKTG